MRHRRMSTLRTKVGIAHADTKLLNNGPGSVPDTFPVLETTAGQRDVTGDTQVIQDNATTGEQVRVGDIVKYINLFIQTCPRPDQGADANHTGWLEWALVMVKESETTVPITDVGIQTLGVICNHMFRNECIFTGAIPCGITQSQFAQIKIKVPKFKQKIRIGDEWRFITYFRSSLSTDSLTTTQRTIKSFMFKAYS